MSFSIVNLGCKVNRVESDAFAAALLARGGVQGDGAYADIVIVNTCTVTGEAEKKTRKAVRHVLRNNAHAAVIVTGCAASIDPATYVSMDARVRVAEKPALLLDIQSGAFDELAVLPAAVAPAVRDRRAPVPEDGRRATAGNRADTPDDTRTRALACDDGRHDAPNGTASALRLGEGFRTRVGVKVQDGCDNACTYCIVHIARGPAKSRRADAIIEECAALGAAGANEIVLTGINLGSYRDEASAGEGALRLAGLLKRLLEATEPLRGPDQAPMRFRISSIEPRDVDDDLIALLASSEGRICRHLHLPLQSGSSKVLRAMARPYTADHFKDLVDRMRRAVPSLSLSTDIIVGFPGETDEQFDETVELARACGFSKIHVFPYSRREGTPAAQRADQIDPHVKARRAALLRRVSDELRSDDLRRRAGSVELALVEDGGIAMTESYHEIPAPPDAPCGSLVSVRIDAPQSRASAKGADRA